MKVFLKYGPIALYACLLFFSVQKVHAIQGQLNIGAEVTQTMTIKNKTIYNDDLTFGNAGGGSPGVLTGQGRIGIATVNPLSTLDVRGNISLDRNRFIYFGGQGQTGEYINENPAGTINLYSGSQLKIKLPNDGTTMSLMPSGGNVGVGTTSPTRKLDVVGDINLTGTLYQNGSPYSASQWTTSGSNIYYISGNVGIGSTSPTQKLDVAGSIKTNEITHSNGRVYLAGNLHIDSYNGNDIYMNYYSQRNTRIYAGSGIQTALFDTSGNTTLRRMDLSNSGSMDNTWTAGGVGSWRLILPSSGNPEGFGAGVGNFGIYGNTSGTYHVIYRTDGKTEHNGTHYFTGNVGIGSSAPAAKLDVAGSTATISNAAGDINITPNSGVLRLNGAVKFSADNSTMSKAPRSIHTPDPYGGCPPSRAANTDLWQQTFTTARSATIQVTGQVIRAASGRVDLGLFVDGSQVSNWITNTGATSDWQSGHGTYVGVIAPGTHTVSFRSPTANVWGCGGGWGQIDTMIFEQ